MSGTDGPIAPWAFRAALSGLPSAEVRDILESDRCPQPEPGQDPTVVEEDRDVIVIRDAETKSQWLRSDTSVSLADRR
ncbi:hypothetical protein [Halorarius litoreus]|uniref:hypothetical protein n=1 Tax=Halorarius litoreus TaxID=2962676 RepID=UPI0020CBB045|nr:hypothetical protein [Halorarius litoreus]